MHGPNGAHLLLVHQPPWLEDDRHRRWKSLREMHAQVSRFSVGSEVSSQKGGTRNNLADGAVLLCRISPAVRSASNSSCGTSSMSTPMILLIFSAGFAGSLSRLWPTLCLPVGGTYSLMPPGPRVSFQLLPVSPSLLKSVDICPQRPTKNRAECRREGVWGVGCTGGGDRPLACKIERYTLFYGAIGHGAWPQARRHLNLGCTPSGSPRTKFGPICNVCNRHFTPVSLGPLHIMGD